MEVWRELLRQSIAVFIGYLLGATLFHLVLSLLSLGKHGALAARKIQPPRASARQVVRELAYGASTSAVFAATFQLLYAMRRAGVSRSFSYVSEWGVPYVVVTTIGLILLNDAYFYWTHRLMHHPAIFRHVHRVHHLSRNPTAFAAFAFHPIEAAIQLAYLPLIVLICPLHRISIMIALSFLFFMNLLGHCGWELFGRGFDRHWLGRWITTSTHHNVHHEKARGNFGLYLNTWDLWFKTTAEDLAQRRARAAAASPAIVKVINCAPSRETSGERQPPPGHTTVPEGRGR